MMLLVIMASRRKKSPRKSRVASGRARDVSGLFLSGNGHRKSTGRYVGLPSLSGLSNLAASAYAQLNSIHDEKLRLEMESTKRAARIVIRNTLERVNEAHSRLSEEQRETEKAAAKLVAEQAEKVADERTRYAKEQRAKEREAERRAAEQRDQMEKQQLAMAKERADKDIKMAEEWAKTMSSLSVGPLSPTPSPPTPAEKIPGT